METINTFVQYIEIPNPLHRSYVISVTQKNKQKDRLPKIVLEKCFTEGLNYSDIGRLYGVSANCIKKWCQFYKINTPVFTHKIPKEDLIQLLNSHSKKEIATILNTTKQSINEWIRSYDIKVNHIVKILCIENNMVFNDYESAYAYVNTKASFTTFKDNINRKNGKYYGYTWRVSKESIYF